MANIISNGPDGDAGATGAQGSQGATGAAGAMANCNWIDDDCATRGGTGGTGGNGGPGGAGGPGGHGGVIDFEVETFMDGVTLQAKGGRGGNGGHGGAGGTEAPAAKAATGTTANSAEPAATAAPGARRRRKFRRYRRQRRRHPRQMPARPVPGHPPDGRVGRHGRQWWDRRRWRRRRIGGRQRCDDRGFLVLLRLQRARASAQSGLTRRSWDLGGGVGSAGQSGSSTVPDRPLSPRSQRGGDPRGHVRASAHRRIPGLRPSVGRRPIG